MNIYEQYAFTKSYDSYGLKVLRIQPKFVAYNVSINKNLCIRSFLVLSATIGLDFLKLFKETNLKVPSIYLDTLVSMKCKYRSYNSRKLRFLGVQILTAI